MPCTLLGPYDRCMGEREAHLESYLYECAPFRSDTFHYILPCCCCCCLRFFMHTRAFTHGMNINRYSYLFDPEFVPHRIKFTATPETRDLARKVTERTRLHKRMWCESCFSTAADEFEASLPPFWTLRSSRWQRQTQNKKKHANERTLARTRQQNLAHRPEP